MADQPRHDARHSNGSYALAAMRWRTGGSVGRTIYAYQGEAHEHARDDESWFIGVMDSASLAQAAVDGHNADLDGALRRLLFQVALAVTDPDKDHVDRCVEVLAIVGSAEDWR